MKSFILLCGGKSRRMGKDKGLMDLNGKPMIMHVIKNLIDVADEIIVVLRDNNQVDNYNKIFEQLPSNRSKLHIFTDIFEDKGPLAGMLVGLENIKSDKAMVVPCDSPFVSKYFVNKMFQYSNEPDFDAIVPRWPDGKLEPLHSIYKKDIKSNILKLLNEDIRDVKSLIMDLNVKYVDGDSLDDTGRSFFNVNRMDDISDYIIHLK
jgi:molybdopterin-guanine dinucleotide biosynthesis protein A